MLVRLPAAFWGQSATVLQWLAVPGKAANILRSTTEILRAHDMS
jgi:hypothetical protein